MIVFFNLILFMTSGAFYPVSGMPSWLSWITTINPEYYGVHALRSIIIRNPGLNVIGIDLIALFDLFNGNDHPWRRHLPAHAGVIVWTLPKMRKNIIKEK